MDDELDTKQQSARRKQRDSFAEDLGKLLFAFGDSKEPKEETIKALEEYLLFFLDKLVTKIMEINSRRENHSNKITKEDVIFAIRNDPKWLGRVAYIIQRKSEIDRINKESRGEHVTNRDI